jgi:hypothetical protein
MSFLCDAQNRKNGFEIHEHHQGPRHGSGHSPGTQGEDYRKFINAVLNWVNRRLKPLDAHYNQLLLKGKKTISWFYIDHVRLQRYGND